jgi:hypothetical protein
MTEFEPQDRELEGALDAGRPEPSRQFGDRLRARLLELQARENRPDHLWALVGAYAGSGTLLLVLAAIAAVNGGL